MWSDVKELIRRNDRFLISTHIHPDGDGLGSAKALISLLEMMGKKGKFYIEDPIHSKFQFLGLDQFAVFEPEEIYSFKPQAVFILDAHSVNRIGRLKLFLEQLAIPIASIDHHRSDEKSDFLQIIDPASSSTGALIYTLFKECGYDLDLQAATALYTSILCDTGRFSNSSTDRKAHKIANECIKKGVDPDLMYTRLFESVKMEDFLVFAKALQTLEFYFDRKVMIQKISFQRHDLETDWIHELNKKIFELECSVVLQEMNNGTIRISIRSKSDVDCHLLAKRLGGGGHKKAAGAYVPGSLDEVKNRVLDELKNHYISCKTAVVSL